MLIKYGNKGLATKCDHHHLVHGPRPVTRKVDILKTLLECMDIQMELLKCLVRHSTDRKMLNVTPLLLHRVVQFMEKMIYLEEKNSGLLKASFPVKFSFLN